MKLIFARHGQSEANVLQIISNRDLPHALTGLGRTQAHQLVQALSGESITHIYTSLILRARQTAEIIATALRCAWDTTDALREFDCGIAEGRRDAEAWQLHHDVIQAWRVRGDHDARIKGGESFKDLLTRFMPFIANLSGLQTHQANDAVLFISHGSILNLMLPEALANITPQWADAHPIGNCLTIRAERRDGKLVCTTWCDLPTPV